MCNEKEFTQAGFDAIAEAMHQLYPDQEGLYYGTVIPYFLGGSDPLDGVEVWKSQKGIPHWHYAGGVRRLSGAGRADPAHAHL